MVDTFGLTLEVISRPYKLEFSIEAKFFPNFFILFFFFLYCLTIAMIWFLSFRYTTESRFVTMSLFQKNDRQFWVS